MKLWCEIRFDGRLSSTRGAPGASACSRSIDRLERLVVDLHQLGGVLRQIAVGCDDAGDRIADKAHLVERQRGNSVGCEPSIGGAISQRRGPFGELAAGHDGAQPPAARAASQSIETMRACACGERTKCACSAPGNTMSSR